MERLLLDIGNTRIKWALDSDGRLSDCGETVHRGRPRPAAVDFVAGLAAAPDHIYAVNVGGAELGELLAKAVEERFGLPLEFVRTTASCGDVSNGYRSIEQLGADRWAALVGAWYRCRRQAVVVDAGTAVTIDLVAAAGDHLGGIIVPGLELMRASLRSDTSDIGGFAANSAGPLPGNQWYGRVTLSAVQRGTLFSLRAVIEQAVDAFAAGGDTPAVVLTGGDAEALLPLLDFPVEHRPWLVLEGLRHLVAGGG